MVSHLAFRIGNAAAAADFEPILTRFVSSQWTFCYQPLF